MRPLASTRVAAKFPHISTYTGRPSTIASNVVSGRAKTGVGVPRPAMLDRTNTQRKTSDEGNNGKVRKMSKIHKLFLKLTKIPLNSIHSHLILMIIL